MRSAAALAALALALAPVAGLAAAPAQEARLTLGSQQEPDGLDSLFSTMMSGVEVKGALYEGLVERDDKWDLSPRIAERIPKLGTDDWTVEKEGDKVVRMRTVWRLRPDLKWSDGEPLTASDFEFAWRLKMDKRVTGIVSRNVEEKIDHIEVPDPRTIVVHWKMPYAYADEGPHDFLPAHVVGPLYEKSPETLERQPLLRTNPVGNGAYRLESGDWKGRGFLTLVPNPHWFGEKARMQSVVFRFIQETNTLVSEFDAGGIQAATPVGMTFPQGLELERRRDADVQVQFTPGLVWEHIDCNTESEELKDRRVRQALLYGMDREKIVKALFEGRQEVAHSWLPPKHYGYNPDLKRYPYDPAKARALLDAAGWTPGPDGIRRKGDRPLQLVIMSTTGNEIRQQVEEILQAQWREIGVGLDIQNQTSTTFFGETTHHRKFPHLAMYAWVFGPSSDGENTWTSDKIPAEKNGWEGDNTCGWVNEEASGIDHKIPVTLDRDERIRLFRRQQEVWIEELPALPLYFRSDVTVNRKGLGEWRPTGSDDPITWNVEGWRWGGGKE